MRKLIAVLIIVAMAVVGMAGAANYMYEKASVKGVGYKNANGKLTECQPRVEAEFPLDIHIHEITSLMMALMIRIPWNVIPMLASVSL